MSERDEGRCIAKEPCPSCGSRDNLARYDDGHGWCFGCGHREPATDGSYTPQHSEPKARMDMIQGEVEAIPNRGLTRETCERYGYRIGTFRGGACHIAPYHDDTGRQVAQKVRFKTDGKKDFLTTGDTAHAGLFGSRLLGAQGGRMVILTEGEIDALSVSQALGNKWPVLSIPKGAQNAARDVRPFVSKLALYDQIVLCFDMDEPGRNATLAVTQLLPPGKVRSVVLPEGFKDASDLIVAHKSKELTEAIWNAAPYRPDGIRTVSELREKAKQRASWGLPWPWATLTKATYGIQRSYVYSWGAGVGSGKTTLQKSLMLTAMRPDLLEDHSGLLDGLGQPIPIPAPRKVGTILFEENPAKTLRSLAGMAMALRINKPDVAYDEAALDAEIDTFDGLLFAFDAFGAKDWATVKAQILHLILVEGVLDIFIDPATALTADADDERRALDAIMAELSGIVETHGATIHVVHHLTTPQGTAHEEGGRVLEKHFTGSRAIARWSHGMIGLERNKQTNTPTTVRGLKDREYGEAMGPLLALSFHPVTGRMIEVPLETAGDPPPFQDESGAHADL